MQEYKYTGELQFCVGASKWAEKSWLGKIYPKKTPDNALLPFYCQNFNTVEFGPAFYTIHSADEMDKWLKQVGDSPEFKFCPKFPQTITHMRRLANADELTAKFYDSLAGFGKTRRFHAAAIGRKFHTQKLPQLKAYLEALPKSISQSPANQLLIECVLPGLK